MSQELQYLRDELNQQIRFQFGQTNSVMGMILVTWGGILFILGKDGVNLMNQGHENVLLYFVGATIFFISIVLLCSFERGYYDSASAILKIAAYILVFYEKRPSAFIKVSENLCWETMNFEMLTDDIKNNIRAGKISYGLWVDYNLLRCISLAFLMLCSVASFWAMEMTFCNLYYILLLLCGVYFIVSIYMLFEVKQHTSPKNDYDMRVKHLWRFFEYSLAIGYYTEQEIKDRFGDIYERCKQYQQTHAKQSVM